MEGSSYRSDPPPSFSSSFPPPPTPQPAFPGASSAHSSASVATATAMPAGPAWGELPSDALAVIINDCGLAQSDVAAVRLTCRHWRHTGATWLRSLSPACASLEQVADIARRFPLLTSVDLTRCDTRLVGHACLCRDASSRLAGLLAALAAMPSLTALTLSDTFSERMGQKMWAAGVCAQALLDSGEVPSGEAAAGDRPGHAAAAAAAAAAADVSIAAHNLHPQPHPPLHQNGFSSAIAAAAAASTSAAASTLSPSTPTRSAQSLAAEEEPAAASTSQAACTAAAAAGTSGSGVNASASASASEPHADVAQPAPSCTAPHADGLLGSGALSEPLARQPREQGLVLGQQQGHGQQQEVGVEQEDADRHSHHQGQVAACSTPDSSGAGIAAAGAPAPGTPGPAMPQQVPAVSPPPAATAGAAGAAATTSATAAAASGPGPSSATCATDPDRMLAELSDPGIKSFARAIARPGATHQHAFWLPDWFGPLASLREVAVRGRQRPASGLPPCLLWLHAGRTAPQLTSLTLTRLGLATLPEQLQHLTALTRLVAQDCSLSLMPRGIASGLSRLQHLDLSLNGLTSLPADFTAMTALQHLDLQRNKLAALPADLGRLSALTCLLLCNNQLRQLPPSLGSLVAVQHLAASYNWLGGMSTSLPLLCSLPRLRRLELACVSDVRCRLVPPQELRLLAPQLTHLDLAANNLVPADVLGTLTCLRTLVLSDCGLLAVPPWVRRLAPSLVHLDLSTNSLSELPPWLPACARLRYLSIAHNRLSLRVPPSVLEQMPQLRVVESE